MPTPDEDSADVLDANESFYRAFAERDIAGMIGVWAKDAPASCIHPGWPEPLFGLDDVLRSWQAILSNPDNPDIRCEAESIALHGDTAVVVCEEHLETGVLLATNIFVREDGAWRMVHHQSGPTARTPEGQTEPEPPANDPGAPSKNRLN